MPSATMRHKKMHSAKPSPALGDQAVPNRYPQPGG
jgi:hypothetical protein